MGLPIKDGKITTPYGKPGKMWKNGHTGVDFSVPQGTDVLAAISGVVSPSNWGEAYGNQLVIKSKFNDKDIWMMYAHLSKLLVKVGDKVVEGNLFKATYIESNRSVVDNKALLAELGATAEQIARHTKTTAVFSVKVTSR